jgi:hypothetical protein
MIRNHCGARIVAISSPVAAAAVRAGQRKESNEAPRLAMNTQNRHAVRSDSMHSDSTSLSVTVHGHHIPPVAPPHPTPSSTAAAGAAAPAATCHTVHPTHRLLC